MLHKHYQEYFLSLSVSNQLATFKQFIMGCILWASVWDGMRIASQSWLISEI